MKIDMSALQRPVNPDFFRAPLLRGLVLALVCAGFIFGFLKPCTGIDFARLHIFLFNLAAGGFVILYFTENAAFPSLRALTFLGLALLYTLLAFFNAYPALIVLSLILGAIVESTRISRFGFFPLDFFRIGADSARKFHQASLLCLSLALFICSGVIYNEIYAHWFSFKKLTLNVFFLGFSFPVSLITMSRIFYFIRRPADPRVLLAEHLLFWTVNLGVIFFFTCIIAEVAVGQAIAAGLLFIAVIWLFRYFLVAGDGNQQKRFLVSGIFFLLCTGITGILYLFLKRFPGMPAAIGHGTLSLHAYLSLYGWNLSGLLVIIRWNDFPLRLSSRATILFHWIVIALLAPLANYSPAFAPSAAAGLAVFLVVFMAGRPRILP